MLELVSQRGFRERIRLHVSTPFVPRKAEAEAASFPVPLRKECRLLRKECRLSGRTSYREPDPSPGSSDPRASGRGGGSSAIAPAPSPIAPEGRRCRGLASH